MSTSTLKEGASRAAADAARPMPKKEKASEGAIVVAEQDGKLSKKDAKVKRRPSATASLVWRSMSRAGWRLALL